MLLLDPAEISPSSSNACKSCDPADLFISRFGTNTRSGMHIYGRLPVERGLAVAGGCREQHVALDQPVPASQNICVLYRTLSSVTKNRPRHRSGVCVVCHFGDRCALCDALSVTTGLQTDRRMTAIEPYTTKMTFPAGGVGEEMIPWFLHDDGRAFMSRLRPA